MPKLKGSKKKFFWPKIVIPITEKAPEGSEKLDYLHWMSEVAVDGEAGERVGCRGGGCQGGSCQNGSFQARHTLCELP